MVLTNIPPDLDSLGRSIRLQRAVLQLTQTQLGDRIGWTREHIVILEGGTYGMPSLPQLVLLSEALELPLTDLIIACGFGSSLTRSPAADSSAAAHHLSCAEIAQTISRLNEHVADTHQQLERIRREMERADATSRQTYSQLHATLSTESAHHVALEDGEPLTGE